MTSLKINTDMYFPAILYRLLLQCRRFTQPPHRTIPIASTKSMNRDLAF